MKEQQFKEHDHIRIRSSNDVLKWLQGEKGRVETVARRGHSYEYSIRFDMPKRGRMMASGLLEYQLEKS